MTQTSDWPSSSSGEESAGSTQEKASQVARSAQDSGAEVAQTAAEQAKSVAAEASRQTRDLLDETWGQLRDQAGSQQQKAVDALRALVNELHAMTKNSGQSGPASELAQQTCARTRRAVDWLQLREPGDLLAELRWLSRRRPGAFRAGAALAGVLAGRLTRGVVAANSNDKPPTSEQGYTPSVPQWTEQQPTWRGEAAPVTEPLYAPGARPAAYPPGTVGGQAYGAPSTYPPVDPPSGSRAGPRGPPGKARRPEPRRTGPTRAPRRRVTRTCPAPRSVNCPTRSAVTCTRPATCKNRPNRPSKKSVPARTAPPAA